MVAKRLTRKDWLTAGISSLANDGHQSLRAERLARALGVSRGSFYWHFPDVEGFEQAVLDEWARVAVDQPYAEATADESRDPSTAMPRLIRAVFRAPVKLERAVRSWATTSAMAAAAVTAVDRRRMSLLANLMAPVESPFNTTDARAVILYWTYLGHVAMGETPVNDAIMSALIEQFCAARAAKPRNHRRDS